MTSSSASWQGEIWGLAAEVSGSTESSAFGLVTRSDLNSHSRAVFLVSSHFLVENCGIVW